MVNWGPIGQQVYERTYSRRKPDGTKETWPETVRRVVNGNLALVPSKYHMRKEREQLIELMEQFAILPAGRHLWVSGVEGRQFLFNCHVAGWNKEITDHYAFLFDELMKGGGVGSNYSDRYIKRYGVVKHKPQLHIVCSPDHPDYEEMSEHISEDYSHKWAGCHRVGDSREGWVQALCLILRDAFSSTVPNHLVLDFSGVRERGSLIRGFGGTASGPGPLVSMLAQVSDILGSRIGEKLTSLDHMLIDHRIAQCVVAGNVRRSARMSIKYWADPDVLDFINCKTDEQSHFTTNISVEIDHAFLRAYKRGDKWAKRVYKECIANMHKNGEPGFWNSSLSQIGEVDEVFSPNPCGEIVLQPWENCNLGHVNLSHFWDDIDGAKKAFRLMARFLVRATFGDIYSSLQQEIVKKNRRIGVGFFGYHNWLCKQGIRYSESHRSPEVRAALRMFYSEVDDESRRYCHQLRIPECIKKTTVAPTGTTAQLAGTSTGAQAILSKYFLRRVRVAEDASILKDAMRDGLSVENCAYNPNTKVISYYCKDPLVQTLEDMGIDPDIIEDQYELSLEDCLAVQAMIQREYADNAISFTVNIPTTMKQKKLYHVVHRFLPELKGTTVFPNKSRTQPPFEKISRKVFEENNGSVGQSEMECKNGVCPIK